MLILKRIYSMQQRRKKWIWHSILNKKDDYNEKK